MEPTNGEIHWGPSAWQFLHGMTLDPLASVKAKEIQKRILHLLRYVLPCPNCRASYRKFSSDRLSETTLECLANYVVEIHDCVNLKLEKPAAGGCGNFWKRFRIHQFQKEGYASYVEDMFFFLFTIAFTYPKRFTQDTQCFQKFQEFFSILPLAMDHRPWGKIMRNYVEKSPPNDFVLSGREELAKWLYGMYEEVFRNASKYGGPDGPKVHSLKTISETMEKMRHKE